VETKRAETAALKARFSTAELRSMARDAAPAREFFSAVTRPGAVRLIAEVKKASPSRGLIRADFDPVAIARNYEAAGAAAISVLTDQAYFQGSLDIFDAVRRAVQVPLLRKEFMIDPIQFYEARAHGADAVLLITSILDSGQLAEFHDLAGELGMSALVETHSEADVERVMTELSPALLGVNNRDLNDQGFHTDLGHTGRMIPLIRRLSPSDKAPAVVSESGIHTADDVARLKTLGVSAVLVGESLMRQADVGAAARELMRLA
jgi:indole-3-glycerol phosphate synthase